MPPIIIDNGTGYTKMGFAGNLDPSYIIPSVLADSDKRSDTLTSKANFDDYDYYIGDEAFEHTETHKPHYIIRGGMIENWELMEKYWHKSFYNYLRAEP